MPRKMILWGLSLFQLLIIAGMLVKALYPLMVGQEVMLKIVAQDPRDIFRGNYVALNYDFSSLDLDSIPHNLPDSSEWYFGDQLYVELKEGENYYQTAGLWTEPPVSGNIYLKAIVQYRFSPRHSYRFINLGCGIETYFTDPENAKYLEEVIRDIPREGQPNQPLYRVAVAVSESGDARIKRLILTD